MTKRKDPNQPYGLIGTHRPKEVRDKISKAHKGKPKNYPSYLKGLIGEKHPSYKHGQSAARSVEYDYEKHAAWIQGVKRAYNYKCFVTGQKNALHCHHLIGWGYEPARYLLENGVVLSWEIHNAFHNEYGRGNNTPEQFERFCEKHYNITYFLWRQGNHKPSFSLMEEQAKRRGFMEKKAKDFSDLVESRGHRIMNGLFSSNNSTFTIRCLIHGTEYNEIKAGLYKRAVFGLNCCSSAKQSAAVSTANRQRAKA